MLVVVWEEKKLSFKTLNSGFTAGMNHGGSTQFSLLKLLLMNGHEWVYMHSWWFTAWWESEYKPSTQNPPYRYAHRLVHWHFECSVHKLAQDLCQKYCWLCDTDLIVKVYLIMSVEGCGTFRDSKDCVAPYRLWFILSLQWAPLPTVCALYICNQDGVAFIARRWGCFIYFFICSYNLGAP